MHIPISASHWPRSYLAEVLERARQEEIRRSASSTRSERQKVERRRLTRRSRVPQEAA